MYNCSGGSHTMVTLLYNCHKALLLKHWLEFIDSIVGTLQKGNR